MVSSASHPRSEYPGDRCHVILICYLDLDDFEITILWRCHKFRISWNNFIQLYILEAYQNSQFLLSLALDIIWWRLYLRAGKCHPSLHHAMLRNHEWSVSSLLLPPSTPVSLKILVNYYNVRLILIGVPLLKRSFPATVGTMYHGN